MLNMLFTASQLLNSVLRKKWENNHNACHTVCDNNFCTVQLSKCQLHYLQFFNCVFKPLFYIDTSGDYFYKVLCQ